VTQRGGISVDIRDAKCHVIGWCRIDAAARIDVTNLLAWVLLPNV
jgi:hypothetical protein